MNNKHRSSNTKDSLTQRFLKYKDVIIQTKNDSGRITEFYTTKTPKMSISDPKSTRNFEVVITSSELEDEKELHDFYSKFI